MKYDFKAVEEGVIDFWKKNNIYQKAKEKNSGKKPFYFLDGPPYTSGKVHIGTAWNKSLKDCILRYKRMSGFDTWDRAGYDMHGLPTEHATQKKVGLQTKEDILSFGVEKFIEECKKLCVENMLVMNKDFQRLGVWMDFDNAYQSITKEFMEGEWWLIKKAHEKGRLYQGLRTMTWCMESESALAKHELEYKTVVDKSIFVKFALKEKPNEFLIIWTTTPWTIPLNLAVMVNPDESYVKCKVDEEYWWVAETPAGMFIQSVADKKYEVAQTVKGKELEGYEYVHPFQKFLGNHYDKIKEEAKKTHTVLLSSEYVDTSSGSGLVHVAPGCGPEDYEVGHKNGIPPFNPVDVKGFFPESMDRFSGFRARYDDEKFIQALDEVNALVATTDVEHDYPHDWRHHKPVIFRATKQWFFKIEDIKEKMIADNNQITWVPKAAFNAFDSWLKHLRDNSISKQRYWGTPIPIWVNVDDENDYLVIGSAKELEELSGKKVDDLHIPSVDPIEIQKDGKTYKRIPDILDVWVDAGTTSWNCLNYPRKTEDFDRLFPADFILEGKDQIRGWFNLLMVASTIAFDKPSFKNVYMHGFVQDAQGRKMSKSVGNYITPDEVVDKWGADAFRYYAIGGANAGLDLNYNFEDLKVKYRNITVFWNVHNYLLDICKNYEINPAKLEKVKEFSREEQYIFSKLNTTIKEVTEKFDSYHLDDVPGLIENLFLELSRTYIQLIRDKAALGREEDKALVAFTIYRVLLDGLKLFSPIAPFVSEKMYQDLKEAFSLEEESIHLCDWPKPKESLILPDLEFDMDLSQNMIQGILAGREKLQRGVRWPVKEVIVVTTDEKVKKSLQTMESMILAQTNTKSISLVTKLEAVKNKVKADFKTLGPDFGEKSAAIIARLAQDSADTILDHLQKDGKHKVSVDGHKIELTRKHIIHERVTPDTMVESSFKQGFLYLQKDMDEHLLAEGYARELMRRVQSLRKNAGLEKKDTIALVVKADEELVSYFSKWEKAIKEKVGAEKMKISTENPAKAMPHTSDEKVKGSTFSIWLEKLA